MAEGETVDLEKVSTKADQASEGDQQKEKPEQTEKSGEGDSTEKQQPGTPDKALQKMQQELGNVTRELQALHERQDAKGELSEADKVKLARAEQRLEKIRKFASRGETGDGLDDVNPLAEQVLELTDRVSKQDQLEAELQAANQRLAQLEADRSWRIVREKYTGLDVDAIWEKARIDALEDLGETGTPDAVQRIASRYFETRCDAAKKRLGDDATPTKKNAGGQASTYRVGSGQPSPQLSESDELLAMARQLVTEE